MNTQSVIVVGGSSGIGLAVATAARAAGARVGLVARDPARLATAASSIGAAHAVADILDAEALSSAFARLGPVDHVYVSAGGFVGGTALEGDLARFRDAVLSRSLGIAHVARAARPHLSAKGSLTLTGGLSTDRPAAGTFATAVGTAAAEQAARVLALELAPVRVNAVSPGWTDTPMWDGILGEAKAETFAGVAAKLPAARIAAAEDVARAVLFLMQNPSVTGEVLHVDGGHRLA